MPQTAEYLEKENQFLRLRMRLMELEAIIVRLEDDKRKLYITISGERSNCAEYRKIIQRLEKRLAK